MSRFELPATRKSLVRSLQEAQGSKSAELRRAQRRGEFIGLYEPAFIRWCRRRGLSETEADEATWTILLRVFKYIESYNPDEGPFRPWLKTIAQRCITTYRSEHPKSVGDGPLDHLATQDAFVELDEEIDRLDPSIALLRLALQRVEDRYGCPPCQPLTWRAFREIRLEGRRPIDVAAEMGVSEGVVSNAAHKVMKRLKAELERLRAEWPRMEG